MIGKLDRLVIWKILVNLLKKQKILKSLLLMKHIVLEIRIQKIMNF